MIIPVELVALVSLMCNVALTVQVAGLRGEVRGLRAVLTGTTTTTTTKPVKP